MNRKIKVLFVFTANQYNVLNEMLWKLADCLDQLGFWNCSHDFLYNFSMDIWLENIGWTIMR
jgi:hypothetical protein